MALVWLFEEPCSKLRGMRSLLRFKKRYYYQKSKFKNHEG